MRAKGQNLQRRGEFWEWASLAAKNCAGFIPRISIVIQTERSNVLVIYSTSLSAEIRLIRSEEPRARRRDSVSRFEEHDVVVKNQDFELVWQRVPSESLQVPAQFGIDFEDRPTILRQCVCSAIRASQTIPALMGAALRSGSYVWAKVTENAVQSCQIFGAPSRFVTYNPKLTSRLSTSSDF